VLGFGPFTQEAKKECELVNASDQPVSATPGLCFFDSAVSFDMIRGGHIDVVVLGAYQVSEKGDLANWGRPGRPASGMGGGMDLAVGAKKVIVTMLSTTKESLPRLKKERDYPITARACGISSMTLFLKRLPPAGRQRQFKNYLNQNRLYLKTLKKSIFNFSMNCTLVM
jgi:3-oxoacid CoA-transferase subunit B